MNQTVASSPFERLVQLLVTINIGPFDLLKVLFIIGLLFYLAFAVIVVRQVGLMIKTLDGYFRFSIVTIAWLHLLLSIAILIFAWIIL